VVNGKWEWSSGEKITGNWEGGGGLVQLRATASIEDDTSNLFKISDFKVFNIFNHFYTVTYLLHGFLPEKLKRPELLKKFPAFYGTRRFITAFTRARHLSLS
jgi:hypothetical protein